MGTPDNEDVGVFVNDIVITVDGRVQNQESFLTPWWLQTAAGRLKYSFSGGCCRWVGLGEWKVSKGGLEGTEGVG